MPEIRPGPEFNFGSLVDMFTGSTVIGPENTNSDIRAYLSTGSLVLDWELAEKKHRGGYPSGRMVEIFGPEAVGKCLVASTYINTDRGLMTVTELFRHAGYEPVCASKEVESDARCPRVVNRHGDLERVGTLFFNGRRETFTVKTRTGVVLDATAKHPLLVMSKTGNWVWRNVENLVAGDFLVSPRHRENVFGYDSIGVDVAYAIGALVADGYLTDRRILVTNDDEHVLEVLSTTLPRLLGKEPIIRVSSNGTSQVLNWSSAEGVSSFYATYGMNSCLAATKEVPAIIRSLCRDEVAAFLRGYLDCECSIDSKNRWALEVSSASLSLLRSVKLLLQQFGVISSVRENTSNYIKQDGTVETYHKLHILGQSFADYIERIGFSSPSRQAQIEGFERSNFCGLDYVPNVSSLIEDMYRASETTRAHSELCDSYMNNGCNPSIRKLRKILASAQWADSAPRRRLEEICRAEYFYDEVESVTPAGAQPTFDFEVPETHSFIANGVVSHNSTLATHALISAQQGNGVLIDWAPVNMGGRSIFMPQVSHKKMKPGLAILIDSECKFSIDRAQVMGLDLGRLVRITGDEGQALTFEACIEKLEAVLKKLAAVPYFQTAEVPIVVALDSLAQAPIAAELEGNGMQDGIAAKARKIRMAMRRITSMISNMNVFMLFTNHTYERINVPGAVSGGGRGLKLAASLRLSIKRAFPKGDLAYSGTEQIGIISEVRCDKSSFCTPPDSIRVPIKYLTGISQDYEIRDYFTTAEPCVPAVISKGARLELTMPDGQVKTCFPGQFPEMLDAIPGSREYLLSIVERTMLGERPEKKKKKADSADAAQ